MKKNHIQLHQIYPSLTYHRVKIAIGIVLGIFLLTGVTLITRQIRPTKETSISEMRTLPDEIKKELSAPRQATISATLRIPILMYHYIEYVQDKKDKIRQSLNINPDIFDKQMQTLVAAGYTFMTARELGEVLDGKKTLPKHPILITFDDGHWDLDTVILPILKKYHVKATAYIIPGFIGGSDFLSVQQLKDVIASGLVEIGAHTVHHVSLKNKLLPVVTYEIDESKIMLENTYHLHVVSFAYPNGDFDQQAANVVKNDGFTTSVSTIPGIAQDPKNRFFLFRLRPGYRVGEELLTYLEQDTFQAY